MTYISMVQINENIVLYCIVLPNDKQTTHYACLNAEYEILLTICITLPTKHTHLYQHFKRMTILTKL